MLHAGKTGTAPGTTTLLVGNSLGHDGGQLVYNAWGVQTPPLRGAGLGVYRPTDFERRGYLGYLPYLYGWIVGTPSLGQTDTPPEGVDPVAYYEQRRVRALALREEEALKTARSARTWAAVGGLVAVGGLIVAVTALRAR